MDFFFSPPLLNAFLILRNMHNHWVFQLKYFKIKNQARQVLMRQKETKSELIFKVRKKNEQLYSGIFLHTVSTFVKHSSVSPWQAEGVWGVPSTE